MKKLAFAALATLAAMTSVNAADIGSYKDTPYTMSPVASPAGKVKWTGFYIGGQIGYGNANHGLNLIERHDSYCFDQFGNQLSGEGDALTNSTTAPVDSFNPVKGKEGAHGLPFAFNAAGTCFNESTNETTTGGVFADDSITVDGDSRNVASLDGLNSRGLIGGGQLGFDYAPGGRYLFGGFASYDVAGMDSEGRVGDIGFTAEKDDEWSIGARAGIIAGERTLLYLLAAYTETDYAFTGRDGDDRASRDVKFTGVSVGGGIEYAVTDNIFVGLQYVHTFYDEETVATFDIDSGLPGHRLDLVDDLDEDKIMLTAKFKLGAF